jgi:methylated-DNA-[protein]-cysteine S-methyltransferase
MNTTLTKYQTIMDSPIGKLHLGASDLGLRWIKLFDQGEIIQSENLLLDEAVSQLNRYFDGQLQSFDVPLDLKGYSPFSLRVWEQLQKIQYGKTISYKELAIRLGDVKCIRAAGTANGRNPIPIIIPCHRVIGSNGDLKGFALGLDVKRKILAIENPTKYLYHTPTLW